MGVLADSSLGSLLPLPPPLADGLALGAAAGLSKTDVELVIFVAIMLHKVSERDHRVEEEKEEEEEEEEDKDLKKYSSSFLLPIGSSCIWVHLLPVT